MKKITFLTFGLLNLLIIMSYGQKKAKQEQNPLLSTWNTPYQTPPFDKIKTEHYLPAFSAAIEQARNEVDAIAKSEEKPTFANTIEALDRSGFLLNRVSGLYFNLLEADATDELRGISNEITNMITEYSNYVSLNEPLFKRVQEVYENKDAFELNEEQDMLLTKTYQNFTRSGANLDPSQKGRYDELTRELSQLSLQFKENVLMATNSYKLHVPNGEIIKNMPEQDKRIAAQKATENGQEGFIFDLSAPSYVAFMKYAEDRELRREMYIAYNSRAFEKGNNNNQVVLDIANKRLELARLLGYETYADYVLEVRMAENKNNVMNFLDQLTREAKPAAQRDVDELKNFVFNELNIQDPIERWDWSYYSNLLKTNRFKINEEETRPYFELHKVKEGIFTLCNRLYGLTFKKHKSITTYHKDVEAYQVFDKDKRFLAVLYLDFYTRPSKRNGAWMTSFREQYINSDGEDIRPLVSLVLNYTPPTKDNPTLLSFDEFNTFLHEFGHALHGILSDVTYQSLSGTSVPRDFVELPSHIMENWRCEREFLALFATHYQTKKLIPEELINKLIEAEKFQSGYVFLRQLNFGTLDMAWHSVPDQIHEDVRTFENRAIQNTEVLPIVEECNISCAFSHIFGGGYAAGYYGYKWAEVLDADAFSLFKENGIFSQKVASSFRENILSKGGTRRAMDMYINFRGKAPSIEPLLERSGLR